MTSLHDIKCSPLISCILFVNLSTSSLSTIKIYSFRLCTTKYTSEQHIERACSRDQNCKIYLSTKLMKMK